MRLPHFAGILVFRHGDGREIDRPEVADEARPGDAQADLRVLPRPVELLGFQNLPHGVTDRDQLTNDADVLLRNAVGAATLASSHLDRLAVEHLHQAVRLVEEIAALANMPIAWKINARGTDCIVQFGIDDLGLAVIDRRRKETDRG